MGVLLKKELQLVSRSGCINFFMYCPVVSNMLLGPKLYAAVQCSDIAVGAKLTTVSS